MTTPRLPRAPHSADDLRGAPLEEVLLFGLTATTEEGDPILGILLGAKRDLGLITSLTECSQPGADFELGELTPVLEGIQRRLNVAIELLTRTQVKPEEPPAAT